MDVRGWRIWRAAIVTAVVAAGAQLAPAVAGAATTPSFYTYTGSTPLARIAPGTVLDTRTVPYHVAGVPLPLTAVQLLYRTTNALGQPTVDVTSVIKAPNANPDRAVAYQSFYDSLNPADSPSYAIDGGVSLGDGIAYAETGLIAPFLLEGDDVIIADTEGETADFAAGPEYGMTTLDSIRAASDTAVTGLSSSARVGLIGYSGGAIASGWAAALAPSYAPDVNARIAGVAEGGVLVDPAHNLHYIQGSTVWAGVLVMALVGVSRAYQIDLSQYLNSYGQSLYTKLENSSIATVLGEYPGLTWAKIAKPRYAEPEDIPIYSETVNKLNLGSRPSPTAPMFIGQGADGVLEGTSGSTPGIGAGDGVMIAGDVRSLARQYCAAGTDIEYQQYDATSHVTSVPLWLPAALSWLNDRLEGQAAPENCATITPGNPLTPLPTPSTSTTKPKTNTKHKAAKHTKAKHKAAKHTKAKHKKAKPGRHHAHKTHETRKAR